MEQIIIKKSQQATLDGLYVYNFENIPQGYIKINNMFLPDDKAAIKRAEKIAGVDTFDFRIITR